MDAGWEGNPVCVESRPHLWNRRLLVNEGGARSRSAGDSLRGDELEGAAGFLAGWLADGVQLVPGWPVAKPVVDARQGRRCVSDIVWRLGRNVRAVVPRWQTFGIHLEPDRGHDNMAPGNFRGDKKRTDHQPKKASLSSSAGGREHSRERARRIRASFGNRR